MGSSSTEVTLAELLHEVPRLWELLDCQSKTNLWDTSPELRKQLSHFVTSIKSVHRNLATVPGLELPDISRLVSYNWACMRSLELTLDPALVPELSNAAWPLLAKLLLNRSSTSPDDLPAQLDEHIFDGFKGKWPCLEHLAITLGKLITAHITALVETGGLR